MMKKFCLFLCICFLLSGCGKYTVKDAEKDLEKKINKLDAYNLTGEMEIINNDDVYKYDVDASYSKSDMFRVSLKNKTNNHEQIILKNSDGVYVQTLLSDIQSDENKEFKETSDNYIFTTSVNYPNNSDLVRQKIYFDKKLNPTKVEVLNEDDDVLIKMTFNKVDLNAKFKDKYFSLDENMKVSKTEDSFESVSKIDEEIYPMYIPENTSLTDKETVSLDNGERVIMTFEGDNPFMFVQQTASLSDEETILSVMGEPCQMATGVAAVSDNMVSWISNGIEYYVVADNMSESELLNVANSVSVLPVSK